MHAAPIRRIAMHDWHARQGAVFIEAGQWARPRYATRAAARDERGGQREAEHVRAVGICDVSTLGKIDIQGADAAEFLNRVYINGFAKLPVGKARYGVMLREDGHIYDDGTTSRLAEDHYIMTTTTANAGKVMTELEYFLQVVWPELDVSITSVTDLWAAMSIAGPKSREVLQALDGDIDLSNEGLPFMGVAEGTLAGMPAKVYRISFSGELAYEVAVESDYGLAMWEASWLPAALRYRAIRDGSPRRAAHREGPCGDRRRDRRPHHPRRPGLRAHGLDQEGLHRPALALQAGPGGGRPQAAGGPDGG